MPRDFSKIKNQLMIQSIKRWHLVPMVSEQTVADHTCGVALVAKWIWNIVKDETKNTLLIGDKRWKNLEYILVDALEHDFNEVGFGDKPRLDKSLEQRIKEFNTHEIHEKILILADFAEAYLTLERLSPCNHGMEVSAVIGEFVIRASLNIVGPKQIPSPEHEDAISVINSRINRRIIEGLISNWDYSVGR